jgi:hypothetical protein
MYARLLLVLTTADAGIVKEKCNRFAAKPCSHRLLGCNTVNVVRHVAFHSENGAAASCGCCQFGARGLKLTLGDVLIVYLAKHGQFWFGYREQQDGNEGTCRPTSALGPWHVNASLHLQP